MNTVVNSRALNIREYKFFICVFKYVLVYVFHRKNAMYYFVLLIRVRIVVCSHRSFNMILIFWLQLNMVYILLRFQWTWNHCTIPKILTKFIFYPKKKKKIIMIGNLNNLHYIYKSYFRIFRLFNLLYIIYIIT